MGSAGNLSLVDRDRALAAVGGDRSFLAELAGIVGAACPILLERVQAALAAGDLPATAWSAHLLRVAAEEVGAGPVANTALALEPHASSNDFDAVNRALRTLQQEVGQLKPALARLEYDLLAAEPTGRRADPANVSGMAQST